LERRAVPGESREIVVREIESLLPDSRASAVVTLERPPSEVAIDHPLAAALARAASDPVIIGVAYWMDMALLNAAGIPCVAYGPSGGDEHADVEWVDIASVQRCIHVYLRAAELLCN